MNRRTLLYALVIAVLLSMPTMVADAANTVSSNSTSNSTSYTTSAVWGELHNITLVTSAGNTTLTASWDAAVNWSQSKIYGRFLRDGVSLGTFNLTNSMYSQAGSYTATIAETAGTHYYGWEVYSTAGRKGTIHSRNFTVSFITPGEYVGLDTVNASAQIAGVTQVTGLRGEQDAQNTTMANKTEFQALEHYQNTTMANKTEWQALDHYQNTTFANKTEWQLLDHYQNTTMTNKTEWQAVNDWLNATFQGIDHYQNVTMANKTEWQALAHYHNITFANKTEWQAVEHYQNVTMANKTEFQGMHDAANASIHAINETKVNKTGDTITPTSVNSSYYNTSDGRELQNGGCDAAYCIRYNLTDGTTIEAVNGTDGSKISGTNASTVGNSALSAIPTRTEKRTVKWIGNFTINQIKPDNYTVIDITDAIFIPTDTNQPWVLIDGKHHIDVIGGSFNGFSVLHGSTSQAVFINNSYNITVSKGNYIDIRGKSIYSSYVNDTDVHDNYFNTATQAINGDNVYNSSWRDNVVLCLNAGANECMDQNTPGANLKIAGNKVWYNGTQQAIDTTGDEKVDIIDNEVHCTDPTNQIYSVRSSQLSTVSGNKIYDCYIGISHTRRPRASIHNNELYNNNISILINGSDNIVVRDNDIFNSSLYGIKITNYSTTDESTNSTYSGNNIFGYTGSTGILVDYGRNNTLTNNHVGGFYSTTDTSLQMNIGIETSNSFSGTANVIWFNTAQNADTAYSISTNDNQSWNYP